MAARSSMPDLCSSSGRSRSTSSTRLLDFALDLERDGMQDAPSCRTQVDIVVQLERYQVIWDIRNWIVDFAGTLGSSVGHGDVCLSVALSRSAD